MNKTMQHYYTKVNEVTRIKSMPSILACAAEVSVTPVWPWPVLNVRLVCLHCTVLRDPYPLHRPRGPVQASQRHGSEGAEGQGQVQGVPCALRESTL